MLSPVSHGTWWVPRSTLVQRTGAYYRSAKASACDYDENLLTILTIRRIATRQMRNMRMSTQHTCMRTRKCGNVRACMRMCVRAYVCACVYVQA